MALRGVYNLPFNLDDPVYAINRYSEPAQFVLYKGSGGCANVVVDVPQPRQSSILPDECEVGLCRACIIAPPPPPLANIPTRAGNEPSRSLKVHNHMEKVSTVS